MSNIQQPARVFRMGSVRLPDPSAQMTPKQVRDLYAANYPHLAHASVAGPEVADDGMELVYTFEPPAAKTKG